MFIKKFERSVKNLLTQKFFYRQYASFNFGEKEFWEDFYIKKKQTGKESFEWFIDSKYAADLILESLSSNHNQKKLKLLHIGCGTSLLGVELHSVGHQVVNIDNSEEAIKAMNEKFGKVINESLIFECMDLLDMPKTYNNYFDAVIDKGTLDAMMYGDKELPKTVLKHLSKTLKTKGELVQITTDPPEVRLDLLREVLQDFTIKYNWISANKDSIEKDDFDSENTNSINYYMYRAQKTK